MADWSALKSRYAQRGFLTEEKPALRGSGPAECSSSRELSVLPGCIFDTNRYYAELGVDPRATRKQLRLAYVAKDGPNDARLTYVFHQLLNPEIRFAYDCTPLGSVFWDEYVKAENNRRLKDRLSQQMASFARRGFSMGRIDPDRVEAQIADAMGLVVDSKDDSDTPDEVLDRLLGMGQDDARPAEFYYSYYLWKTRFQETFLGLAMLAAWQQDLVRALSKEGVHTTFSVGYHGQPHRWVQAQVGYRMVFFLNIDHLGSTEDLAAQAAHQYRLDLAPHQITSHTTSHIHQNPHTETKDTSMTDNYEEYDFTGSMGADVAKESGGKGGFEREIAFLALDASDSGVREGRNQKVIRLFTQISANPALPTNRFTLPWITVAQHYANTKQRPPYVKEKQTWPQKMFVGCRKDKVFTKRFNGQCIVCDQGSKSSGRTWALAVEREQVIENSQVLGYRDKTREVMVFGPDNKPVVLREVDGKKEYQTKIVPAFLILNFGYKNFFGALEDQGRYFQSVTDQDFVVQRRGTGQDDTAYSFIPLGKITLGENNPYGLPGTTPYDMTYVVDTEQGTNRPITLSEKIYPDLPDLRKFIADKVSDDFFGRYFVPGWVPEGFDPNQMAQGNQQGYQAAPQQVQQGVQQGYQPPAAPAVPQPTQQQQAAAQQPAQQAYQQPAAQQQQPMQQQMQQAAQAQQAQTVQQQEQAPVQQAQPVQQQGSSEGPSAADLAALRDRVMGGSH